MVGNYSCWELGCILPVVFWVLSIVSFVGSLVNSSTANVTMYGKLEGDSKGEGLFASLKVPKKWFTHFYVAGVAWNGMLLAMLMTGVDPIDVIIGETVSDRSLTGLGFCERKDGEFVEVTFMKKLCMGMLVFQCFRRLQECLFVSVFSEKARMHVTGYLIGISYYLAAGWTITVDNTTDRQISSTMQSLGLACFVLGNIGQFHSHLVLAELRNQKSKTSAYLMPKEGLFRFVSCPHYTSELLIYSSFVILMPASLGMKLILCFACLNLGTTAMRTHAWYKMKFKEDHPTSQKAIIPFIL